MISAKYLKLYYSSIGISRVDLMNCKVGSLCRKFSEGINLPERVVTKNTAWISESLQRRQAQPFGWPF